MKTPGPARCKQTAKTIKDTFLRFLYATAFALSTVACSLHPDDAEKWRSNRVTLSDSITLSYLYVPSHLRTDPDTVGAVTFARGTPANPKETVFFIRRIEKGYVAETPLSQKDFPVYFSIGKDKRNDYFTGLRFRMEF